MARQYPGLVGLGNLKDERIRKYFALLDETLKDLSVAIGAAAPPGQNTGGASGGPVSITIEYVDEGDAIDTGTEGLLVFGRGDDDDLAHALNTDADGRLNVCPIDGQTGVSGGAGASGAATVRVIASTDSPDVTALQIIDDWDESDRAKTNPIVGQAGVQAGAGAVSANTQRVVLATDDPAVASLAIIDDWDETDRAKVNPIVGQAGLQGGSGAVSANTVRVTLATDVALPAGNANIGDVDIASLPNEGQQTMANSISVAIASDQTTVGRDTHRSIDLDESEEEVKATAGKVYAWSFTNLTADFLFVKFYNDTAANTDVGTDTPQITIPVAPYSTNNLEVVDGITFTTAICVACTTGIADADTGAPGANELVAAVFYK